jgi:predicted GIY-YIG superfamily endonuclease
VKIKSRLASTSTSNRVDDHTKGANVNSLRGGGVTTLIPENEQESIPYDNNSIEMERRFKHGRRRTVDNVNISVNNDETIEVISPQEQAAIVKSLYDLRVISKKDL